MNESRHNSSPRRFLFLSGSEWLTTVVSIVALVLLIFSYDAVLIRGNPSTGLRGGCYCTLSLTPGARWIPPLQPYFSIIILAVDILAPSRIARRRKANDSKARNA
jgi:hypothetical protein